MIDEDWLSDQEREDLEWSRRAVEANAKLTEARARQRRFTNEELERFSAPPEWGVLYEPPKRRRR